MSNVQGVETYGVKFGWRWFQDLKVRRGIRWIPLPWGFTVPKIGSAQQPTRVSHRRLNWEGGQRWWYYDTQFSITKTVVGHPGGSVTIPPEVCCRSVVLGLDNSSKKKKTTVMMCVCVCVFEWKERWCYHSTYVTLVMSWLEIKHFTSSCSSGFTVSLNLSGHRGAVLGFGKPLDQHQKWVLIIKYFNSMYHTLASWALRSGSMGSLSFENWICTGWTVGDWNMLCRHVHYSTYWVIQSLPSWICLVISHETLNKESDSDSWSLRASSDPSVSCSLGRQAHREGLSGYCTRGRGRT